ncbi:exo-alpha-sialidase [candidate division KSB1 bacterium]|nr:exo-alpha-sialidase [candidate division KSB1 bacterium]
MRNIFLLILCSFLACQQSSEDMAVYISGKGGYHTYRIPALLLTPGGTLLAFCEGRKNDQGDSGDIDLLVKRSTDNGSTWSPYQVIWDDSVNVCGNPCPVIDRNSGTICLLMTWNRGDDPEHEIVNGSSDDTRRVFIAYSRDEGLSWSDPREITEMTKKPQWSWYATGPGAGIQLRQGQHAGRLLIPCDHKVTTDSLEYRSHVIYSDDGGETWHIGGSTNDGSNECQMIERRDGTLFMSMRRARGVVQPFRLTSISPDAGMSWTSSTFDSVLIGPRCQGSMIKYRGVERTPDEPVLHSNPAHRSERIKMTVRLSEDDGRTWDREKCLYEGASAYSCLAMLPDGRVACLYENGDRHPYERISLARFGLDSIQ